MSSSSSSCTTEERARALAYAEAECDRIQPRCRDAYRATIFAKRCAEIIEDRNRQAAFQGLLIDQALAKLEAHADHILADEASIGGWVSDPAERRAAMQRGLLLARMEAEQGVDATW